MPFLFFIGLNFGRFVYNGTTAIQPFRFVFCFLSFKALIHLDSYCAEEVESAERRADRIEANFHKQVFSLYSEFRLSDDPFFQVYTQKSLIRRCHRIGLFCCRKQV